MYNSFFYTSPEDINGDDGDDRDDSVQQSPPSEQTSLSYLEKMDKFSTHPVSGDYSRQSHNQSSHSTSSFNKELTYIKRSKAIQYLQHQQARKKRTPDRVPDIDVVEV